MNIVIVGGNGGIGYAIVEECIRRYPNAHIFATYRKKKPEGLPEVTWFQLDVSQETEVQNFANHLSEVDWVINCVGLLHTKEQGPEKSLDVISAQFFQQNIMTNTLPTLLLAKYFTPKLKRSLSPKFATVSAKVGSISDNRLGGWYSYRASKAALNMILKTMSIEWQRSLKQGVVLALHPGTTDTNLSKPFQARVPESKLFTAERVARDLVNLIATATPAMSGTFLAYDGAVLDW